MARVTYKLKGFDDSKAKSGALCVMVKASVSDTGTISNINDSGVSNDSFVGAGICRNVASNLFELTIDSNTYQFDGYGKGKSPDSIVDNYKLLLGTADVKIETSGNAIKSNNTTITTRADDGSTTTKVDYSKESDIIIDSLNARDEFAMRALGEMLSHISNPSNLSDSEMNYYCNAAYRWAANMLYASANARGSFKQTEGSSTSASTTTRADVDSSSLTSNSEKLLNNIVSALERTDVAETVNEKTLYSKRVKVQFKELIDMLTTYIKDGSTENKTLGLKDLITAIKSINLTTGDTDFSELVEAIKNIKVTSSDTVSIGSDGLGKDSDHPIFMSGGGFPTKKALAAAFEQAAINSFLTFNSDGAVGYSTLGEVKKATAGWIANYDSLETLYMGSVEDKDNILLGLNTYVKSTIDKRVKAWLNQTTIESDGNGGYKLKVPDSILILQSGE